MSLNIKNETVHDLVRRAARETGQSQTTVVETAVRNYLDELNGARDRAGRKARVDAVLAEFDASGVADRIPPTSDFLYDENGLPA